MKITVKDVADFIGGTVFGNSQLEITNIAKIEEAKPTQLSLLYRQHFIKYLDTTKASVLIISKDIEKKREDITYIVADNPNKALQEIIVKFFNPEFKIDSIAPSASVDESVQLGENVGIGENVVIEKNCSIGENTTIYHNTVILSNTKIGKNCLIFPNVTIREDTIIGDNVIIHSGTVVGSDGFGYAPNQTGEIHKIPQIGNVIIEDDVELGSNVSIDRAAMGTTIIRKGAKIDNLVQIAHNVEIGSSTSISAQTGISGSTKVGKHCILAGQVGLADHIEIGNHVLIGAQSGVAKSLPKPGKYFGYPAKDYGVSLRLEAHYRNLPKYAQKIKEFEAKIEELEKKLNDKN